jgi:hypothetical protein
VADKKSAPKGRCEFKTPAEGSFSRKKRAARDLRARIFVSSPGEGCQVVTAIDRHDTKQFLFPSDRLVENRLARFANIAFQLGHA